MRPIAKDELNDRLVDGSTLQKVCFDKTQRVATLTFMLDDRGPKGSPVFFHCKSVFQIRLATYFSDDFSPLGVCPAPTPSDLDQVIQAFNDQYIFEWTMDCDELVPPPKNGKTILLWDEPPPSPPYRGIGVFKDKNTGHFQLLIIGTDLLINENLTPGFYSR